MKFRLEYCWIWVLPLIFSFQFTVTAQGNDRIVFMSDRDGNREIYTMNPDGSDWERLTNHPEQDIYPSWSPDKRTIVFVSNREDARDNIYTMNADGSRVRRLTQGSSYSQDPAFSPDGRYIAYSSDETGSFDIYVMDADGSNPRRLTNSEDYDLQPAWSPDGTQIMFVRDVDFTPKIFVMNNDGSGERLLVSNFENDNDLFNSPIWSPDGTEIAFAVELFFSNGSSLTDIYIYDLQSNEERLVTSYQDTYVKDMSYSEDGESLVYQLQRAGGSNEPVTLNIVSIDGTSSEVLTGTNYNSESPSWSTPRTNERVVIGGGSNSNSDSELSTRPDSDVNCPGALRTRLVPNEFARVTLGGTSNRLRTGPGTNNQQIDSIPPGGVFEVLEGPTCNGGYAWFQVEYDGQVGWTAEADNSEYWLERLRWGPPPGLEILTGGTGQTDPSISLGPGEFQVEYYCPRQGYRGTINDSTNWYCTNNNGSRVYTLQQSDYDQICRDTYRRSDAIARRNGSGRLIAYRWRCYVPA